MPGRPVLVSAWPLTPAGTTSWIEDRNVAPAITNDPSVLQPPCGNGDALPAHAEQTRGKLM